jgi:tRNA A37 methylthiotransferase MiaB
MSKIPSVRLITLGCAKNEVDSEEIAGVLQRAGYRLDAHTDAPDVVIINTCGFLELAQREGMAVIRDALRLKRQGKTQRVIVAGCMVQRLGKALQEQFPEVDAWVGVGQMGAFCGDCGRRPRRAPTDCRHSAATPSLGGCAHAPAQPRPMDSVPKSLRRLRP